LAQKRNATGTALFPGALVGGKFYIFGFSMMRASIPKNFRRFWSKNGPPKGPKTIKKCPLCLFLDTQKLPWEIHAFRGQMTSK